MGANYEPIFSGVKEELNIALFEGKEGLSVSKDVVILEGLLTAREFVDHFSIEANSLHMSAYSKRQRDLDSKRASSLIEYFETRDDTILPSITIFVSKIDIQDVIYAGNRKIVVLDIPSTSDRLLSDGQNRWNLFNTLLDSRPELEDHTVGVKFIITDTETLEPCTEIIRQVFSDYHMKLKKPTPAQNIFFDYSKPLSILVKDLINEVELDGVQLREYISVTGTLTSTQLMDLKQFQDFICTAIGSTAGKTNQALTKNPDHTASMKQMVTPFLKQFFGMMPLKELDKLTSDSMLNKAIFWQAIAWLVRSIMEDALLNSETPDYSVMNRLTKLPLNDMTNQYWRDANVVLKVEEEGKGKEYKMIKGSDKSCARALCKSLRVYYSQGL